MLSAKGVQEEGRTGVTTVLDSTYLILITVRSKDFLSTLQMGKPRASKGE